MGVLGSAFPLQNQNQIVCLHWIVSYRSQSRFQVSDRRSSVGAALKHEGPRGRAGRRVRVQILTGLFCHDQLVLGLPINHCFPLADLQRRQSKRPMIVKAAWPLPCCTFTIYYYYLLYIYFKLIHRSTCGAKAHLEGEAFNSFIRMGPSKKAKGKICGLPAQGHV